MKTQREIFAENLQRLVDERKIDQRDLAVRLNVSDTSISNWLRGKKYPRINHIQELAEYFGVNKSELMEEKIANLERLAPRSVRIPVLGKIACGDPILADENIEEYIYRSPDSVPNGTLFALVAKGDSMYPTIPDGGYVVIREQSDCESGDIVAVLVNGDEEATLKRLKKQGDTIILMPENPNYEPYIVDHDHNARIIGKAISVERKL